MLSALLVASAAVPRSPESYFRQFLGTDPPPSVQVIQHYYRRGFGNHSWAIAFTVDPSEFDAVVSRYPFVRTRLAEGEEPLISAGLAARLDAPMAYRYSYEEPGPGGGLIVHVYSSADHGTVYARGGFD